MQLPFVQPSVGYPIQRGEIIFQLCDLAPAYHSDFTLGHFLCYYRDIDFVFQEHNWLVPINSHLHRCFLIPEMDFSSLFSFEKVCHEGLSPNVLEQCQLQFGEAQWKIGTLYSKGKK